MKTLNQIGLLMFDLLIAVVLTGIGMASVFKGDYIGAFFGFVGALACASAVYDAHQNLKEKNDGEG